MPEDLKSQLDRALSRIAALESQPKAAAAPQSMGLTERQIQEAMAIDPIGFMKRVGVPIDHVTNVAVATALGKDATPELRMLAAQGPQVSAQMKIAQELESLRQRLEAYEAREASSAAKSSFSSLAADKVKYPRLAAALAKSSSVFDDEVTGHKGDAAALADKLEKRLEALGYAPPASNAAADSAEGQSKQTEQAHTSEVGDGGTVDTTPPPAQGNTPGLFTQAEHLSLKDRIIRKYGKTQ